MAAQIISDVGISSATRAVLEPLVNTGPAGARVHLRVPFRQPSAYGVTFRKPGRRPHDPALAALYCEAPKQERVFIIAIRDDVVKDVRLILTLAHEFEHVRQELACAGLLELGSLARDFVAANHSLFQLLPCELFVPVNLHAEARAKRDAIAILGESSVNAHYADKPDLAEQLDQTDPGAAATDLATFFRTNWQPFEIWYTQAIRPGKPLLATVREFVERPC